MRTFRKCASLGFMKSLSKKDYPKTKAGNCVLCGAAVTLVRRGSGVKWGNGLDYFYTYSEKHECEQLKAARKTNAKVSSEMSKIFRNL